MKFKVFILLVFFSLDAFTQCCCGKFYFRIHDALENKIYPAINDTFKMNIDTNVKNLGYCKQINGKKLPATKLFIKTMKTEGNAERSAINLSKFSFTNLLLEFSTGCFMQLKKISFTKGDKKMILNFVDIPKETMILMDSIPFVEGEVTYNIEKIVKDNKLCYYENLPGTKFYLHYLIPHSLTQTNLPKVVTQEFKNDTLYYYSDSLKMMLVGKGKAEIIKSTGKRYDELNMKWETVTRGSYVKNGEWIYYFENYTLIKTEKWNITQKEHHNNRQSRTRGRYNRELDTGY